MPSVEKEICDWLLSHESRVLSMEAMLAGLADRLLTAGVPLWRMVTSLRTLHPEIFVKSLNWRQGEPVQTHLRPRELIDSPTYLDSPIAVLHRREADQLRCRLQGPEADLRFTICRDFAAEGGTDYLICALDYSDGQRSFVSFASDRPGGFNEADLELLRGLIPVLALRNELAAQRFATECLLKVYLGPNAAAKVLCGKFLRGNSETLQAVIWFSDMRGFTALSDRVTPAELVALLDRFFDAQVEAISAQGGEVLKFIGDAVLAIFPLGDAPGQTCQAALAAAQQALSNIAGLHLSQAPELAVGIGLHLGEFTYGNIGATGRLDFTVIGASVNTASRVEGLCKVLGQPLLLTDAFAAALGLQGLTALGPFDLRGVREPVGIFAPDQTQASS